jgi:hypothetical protein|tara:strand:+ start:702 stop:1121 length:420 start_codon:yes stop_codon:yes gene_type:complete
MSDPVLASLEPLSPTVLSIQEDNWFVTLTEVQNEIVVYKEVKTNQVDTGVYFFDGSMLAASGYTVVPSGRITTTNIQTAIQNLDDTLSARTTAPSTPIEGSIYYDTDDNILRLYINSAWVTLAATSLTNSMSTVSGGTF